MKRCQYCGKEYADGVMSCPVDGSPVVDHEGKHGIVSTPPEITGTAFNVRLVSPFSSAGKYRVFIERSDLLFIQVEAGSKSVLEAAAPLIGPIGGLLSLILWLFNKKGAKVKLQRLETDDPEKLLRESESNFKLNLAEIRDAAIEAPAFFQKSGKAGRLNFLVRHGEKIKCEFEDAAGVATAIRLLVPLLHSTLKVNVEWNVEKERFERKKTI